MLFSPAALHFHQNHSFLVTPVPRPIVCVLNSLNFTCHIRQCEVKDNNATVNYQISDHADTEAPIKMNYSISSSRLEVKAILVWGLKFDIGDLTLNLRPKTKIVLHPQLEAAYRTI